MHLKALSYNIHKGRSASGLRYLIEDIKQAVHSTHADIVFLQEIHGFNNNAEDSSNIADPLEHIADTIWHHFRYGKNAVYSNGHHGNAILSKYPIIHFENTDISQTPFAKRGLLHATIKVPDHLDELHLLNVHLDLFEQARQKQYEQINNYIEKQISKTAPIILAGDFNDWQIKATKALHQSELTEAFTQTQDKPAKTFPSFFPMFSLDRLYYRGLNLTSAETPSTSNWSKLSDHIPLLVKFHL